MSLTQLTERARVPRAQVFRAFQALLVPLAPLGVVEVARPCAYDPLVDTREGKYQHVVQMIL